MFKVFGRQLVERIIFKVLFCLFHKHKLQSDSLADIQTDIFDLAFWTHHVNYNEHAFQTNFDTGDNNKS